MWLETLAGSELKKRDIEEAGDGAEGGGRGGGGDMGTWSFHWWSIHTE
jgi:hypothetical protein